MPGPELTIACVQLFLMLSSSTSCDTLRFVCKQISVNVYLKVNSLIMVSICFCRIYCFLIFSIGVVISDVNNLHESGSFKAALQYDRQLFESEVAKRPHLVMFYAPWYEFLFVAFSFDALITEFAKVSFRSRHAYKYKYAYAYKFSFLPRSVTDWNALPPSTRAKQSTDSFKKVLYKLPDDSTYHC